MQIIIEDKIKRIKFEGCDKIASPEKTHTLRVHNNATPTTYYLNEEDYLKKVVFDKERDLYKDKSSSKLKYQYHKALRSLKEFQGSALRCEIAGINETVLKQEMLKLREQAKLKPANYIKSPERPNTHVKMEHGKQVIIYLSDSEKLAREKAIELQKKLHGRESIKITPSISIEVSQSEYELKLYNQYTSDNSIAFFFLVDLANILGITSGKNNLGVDAFEKYKEVIEYRLNSPTADIGDVFKSSNFKLDLNILTYYCTLVESGKLQLKTYKEFSLLWIERKIGQRLDKITKLELYEPVLENLGRSPILKLEF